MSREHHERITELFEELLALDPQARVERLERNDLSDDLRAELRELLDYADRDDAFAEEKIGRIAQEFAAESPDETRQDARHPETIGRYRILREIGRGGMGVVYEAEQSSPQRRVALKVLQASLTTPEAVRRFERETEILGRLRHPGIAHIYEAVLDAGQADDRPFFAMELIDGLPLDEHVREHDLALEQRVTLVAEACDAIHYAHANGVLHRDLKPSNILVDKIDGGVKILDFGIARAIDSKERAETLQTDPGHIIGTIAYMSPEQIEPTSLIDTRSDVYTLGVILYELLTGVLPFDLHGQGIVQAARSICDSDPVSPDAHDSRLRGDLTTIIRKAMSRDRDARYASAAAFGDDLRRYLRDEPITARPASGIYQIRMLVKRHRTITTVSLAALLLIMVASIWALVERTTAIEQRRLAVEQGKVASERSSAVTRLSDLRRLRILRNDFEAHWPPHPEHLGGMQEWIDEARDLLARIPLHQERLALLRSNASPVSAPGSEDGDPEYDFGEDVESAWWYETLSGLVAELRALGVDHPTGATLPQMIRRRDFATSIEERSKTSHEAHAAWSDAIAYAGESSPYAGLELTPILGLFPLGPDPESGLLEFWHIQSGERPERDSNTNRLSIGTRTGLVFVLLPGGTFHMGSSTDPGGINPYAQALENETPAIEVTLDAFLLSKYEITAGQWMRLAGAMPEDFRNAEVASNTTLVEFERNPVTHIEWNDCRVVCHRGGFLMPTEAQWEYACRAGTSTPWFTGIDKNDLARFANLADASFQQHTGGQLPAERWNDTFRLAAPVGAFEPNAFGLHDMHGNVWEWCRDRMTVNHTAAPLRAGDGFRELRSSPGQKLIDIRVTRGGSFYVVAAIARSAVRARHPEGHSDLNLGFRPSMALSATK